MPPPRPSEEAATPDVPVAQPSAIGHPSYTEKLPCAMESAATARSLVRTALAAWRLDTLTDDAVLVASELATILIRYTRCRTFRITVSRPAEDRVRIEAEDRSRAAPVRRSPANDEAFARGLAVINALAHLSGSDCTRTGKTAWAELHPEPDPQTAHPRPPRPTDHVRQNRNDEPVRGTFAEKMAAFTHPTTDQEYSPIRRYIGLVCTYAREQAGMSQGQLGRKISYADSLIAHIEAGRRLPTPEYLEAAEAALPSRGLLAAASTLLATVDHTRTRRAHPELECGATSLHYWAPQTLPVLLQTEDYARALLRHQLPALDDEQTCRAMHAWHDRQSLAPGDEPPLLTFILDESVLRRRIGGPAVMHQQLIRLLEHMDQPGTTIQIAPQDDAYYPPLTCPTAIAEHTRARTTAYIEDHQGTTLVHRGEHLDPLIQHFGHLRGYALSPEASAHRIQNLAWKLALSSENTTEN